MSDPFEGFASGLSSPATDAFAITPHDDNDLATVPRALYVGTGGNIVVITQAGTELTLTNAQDGQIIDLRVSRVKATNTTASGIVGLV